MTRPSRHARRAPDPSPAPPAAPRHRPPAPITDAVRARLAGLLAHHQLSQRDLAKDLGGNQSTISMLLAGKRHHGELDLWAALADRFDYRLSELIAEAEQLIEEQATATAAAAARFEAEQTGLAPRIEAGRVRPVSQSVHSVLTPSSRRAHTAAPQVSSRSVTAAASYAPPPAAAALQVPDAEPPPPRSRSRRRPIRVAAPQPSVALPFGLTAEESAQLAQQAAAAAVASLIPLLDELVASWRAHLAYADTPTVDRAADAPAWRGAAAPPAGVLEAPAADPAAEHPLPGAGRGRVRGPAAGR